MFKYIFFILSFPFSSFAQGILDSSIFIFKKDKLSKIEYKSDKVEMDYLFNGKFALVELNNTTILNKGIQYKTSISLYDNGIVKTYIASIGDNEYKVFANFDIKGKLEKMTVFFDTFTYNVVNLIDLVVKAGAKDKYSYILLNKQSVYDLKLYFDNKTKRLTSVNILRDNKNFGTWFIFDEDLKLNRVSSFYNHAYYGLHGTFSSSKPFIIANDYDTKHEGIFTSHTKYKEGIVAFARVYKDGGQNGNEVSFFKNGKVSSIFYLLNDRAVGKRYFYRKNGKIKRMFDPS